MPIEHGCVSMDALAPGAPTSRGRADDRAGRRLARPQSLPGGRAVVGGLLVAAAAVGTYAAHGAATGSPASRYVVVTRDVAPGRALEAGDLATVAVDLPGAQRAVSFTEVDILRGAVTLGALRAGQLVQSSDVAKASTSRGLVEISVPVEPGRAMNGERRYLRGGDRVDVVATASASGKSATTTVATDAEVVEVLDPRRGGIGGGSTLTVVLAVRPANAEAVAGAAAGSTISLIRTTGLRP